MITKIDLETGRRIEQDGEVLRMMNKDGKVQALAHIASGWWVVDYLLFDNLVLHDEYAAGRRFKDRKDIEAFLIDRNKP